MLQTTACHWFHSKKARLFSGFKYFTRIYFNHFTSRDHSPILYSLSKNIDISRGKEIWKFNNSLCHKPGFVIELKNHLKVICNRMSGEQITDEQLCWEYIKYEIRKFSSCFSNENAKKDVPKLWLEKII